MDVDKTMDYMSSGSLEGIRDKLEGFEKKLADEGMPAHVCVELQYKYPITVKGKDYSYTFQCGMGTDINDYASIEGSAPSAPDEIAITPAVAKFLDIDIGDRITVHFADKDMDCIVTQLYETMNNMGELIRFHTDATVDIMHYSSAMGLQINFDDHPDAETIEARKDKVSKALDTDEVMNAEEYCVDCMKVAPMMEALAYLLLAITMVVILLVTILTERTLIAGEVTQIATLKAIGFSNGAIVRWHTWRFVIVGIVVAVLSAAFSIPLTKLFGDPIYTMVGKTDVTYKIDVFKTFFMYPGAVLVVTVVVAAITATFTKKITARDTANIE
jgi:putative ABC transport system permease protein